MSEENRQVVRVSPKTVEIAKRYAEKRECNAGEAVDQLVMTAHNRLQALARYGKNTKTSAKPRPKKKAAKKNGTAAAN